MIDKEKKPLHQDTKEKIVKYKKERDDYLEGWKRAKADLLNEKKNFSEILEKKEKMIIASCINNFIPPLDSFFQAKKNKEVWENVDKNWRVGIEAIHSQLKDAMMSMGVSEILPKKGEDFDPKKHQVVETNKGEENKIISLCSPGYEIADFVIKPACVIIGKKGLKT